MNRQGIEGIADHLKVTGYRPPKKGERLICNYATHPVKAMINFADEYHPIVEPDNVYNVYDLADVKIPEGYEFAEFRATAKEDSYITKTGELFVGSCGTDLGSYGRDGRRIIVKAVKKTRRVLVVEQDIPEDLKIDSVMAINDDICAPDVHLNYFIETREVTD